MGITEEQKRKAKDLIFAPFTDEHVLSKLPVTKNINDVTVKLFSTFEHCLDFSFFGSDRDLVLFTIF